MKQRVIAPAAPTVTLLGRTPELDAAQSLHPGRVIKDIALELIDPNPLPPRVFYTDTMLEQMAESLAHEGQRELIHVIRNPDNPARYVIADGWTRVRSAVQYGVMQELTAQVHEMTITQAAMFGYRQNVERNQCTDLDTAMLYISLIEQGVQPAEIAQTFKRSATVISKLKAFARLEGELKELVHQNAAKFSYNAVYLLLGLEKKGAGDKAVKIARRYVADERSYDWLESQVNQATKPIAEKPAESHVVRYQNGSFRHRDGVFRLDITIDGERRGAFEQKLAALVGEFGVPLHDGTDLSTG